MIEKIKKFIRIVTILLMTALVIFLIYTIFKYEWKNILCFVSVITVFLLSVGRLIGERGEVKCMMNRKMLHS